MKQSPSKRPRGNRPNGRRPHFGHGHTYESNGPDVKIRGNAVQVLEKYQALARDALSSGDRVAAENYFQHAEHYYRLMNAHSANSNSGDGANGGRQGGQRNSGQRGQSGRGDQGNAQPGTAREAKGEPDTDPGSETPAA